MMMQGHDDTNPIKSALIACKSMAKYILLFGLVLNLLMMCTSVYSLQVLDRVLSTGNLDTLTMLTIVTLLAMLLQGAIQGARAFAMNRLGSWFEVQLSETVFVNAIRSALKSRQYANSQQLRDLQTIKTYITSPGLTAIMDIPWAIIFIIALFILHNVVGWIAVIGGTVLVVLGFIADSTTKKMLELNNENMIKSMRQVDQTMRNAEVIEVMGMRANVINVWQQFNKKVQTMQSLTGDRHTIFSELIRFVRSGLQISVTCIGATLVLKHEFSAGAIIASSTLIGRALAPFEIAINSWKGYINCRKSYERLKMSFAMNQSEMSQMSLPTPEGSVEVENLYFAYPGSTKHLLKGISFSLQPGEMLAIIGASGSGKTTLSKIISGCYTPTIGSVRVDGASLNDWRRQELGQYIGYLPQDVELFGGTVRSNIARMEQNPDPEKVIEAAQLAGVHDLILHLPNAYDTELGFDGSTISGGQRQRIGLARAFYGDPKILILDEPNANLDAQGDAALTVALEVAKEKKITTVIVSHKPQLLNIVDKILVMQDGMVVTYGPKKEVLEKLNKNAQQQRTIQ